MSGKRYPEEFKTEADLNAFSRMLTKLALETALNAELTEHLGHEKMPRKQARIPATDTRQKRCFTTWWSGQA